MDYTHRGGLHWETGGLAGILAAQGVRAPHTGEPYTEPMLIGIGGGLGGGYFCFEMCGGKYVVPGFRRDWQKYKGEFAAVVCQRLGVPVEVTETGSKKRAEADLQAALEAGRPVLATAAEAGLPHRGLPRELAKGLVHGVVVYGVDGDEFLIDDLCEQPVRVSWEDMTFSRSIITCNDNRMLTFGPPVGEVNLEAAVREGLEQCAREMLHPPIRNFGISAWEKWAALMVHPKDKKGWPSVLHEGKDLFDALTSVYGSMKKEGGTDALRGVYAGFLEEASAILGKQALAEVAGRYRRLEGHWRVFALAVLPDRIPALAEARRLIEARYALLRKGGSPEYAALNRIHERRQELRETPGLLVEEREELLADLSARLREIHALELEAIRALAVAVG